MHSLRDDVDNLLGKVSTLRDDSDLPALGDHDLLEEVREMLLLFPPDGANSTARLRRVLLSARCMLHDRIEVRQRALERERRDAELGCLGRVWRALLNR